MERTDYERFSEPPAPLLVSLGGREFSIAIQRKGKTAQFRKKFRAALGQVDDLGRIVATAMAAIDDSVNVPLRELPVQEILAAVLRFLDEGAEQLLGLIYEYDPALAAERDWIEENAYDHEVCEVLVALLKAVYGPFLTALLPGMKKATGATEEGATEAI